MVSSGGHGHFRFPASSVPPALPSGVTLQAIDGESLTSPTTMTNNYYVNHGFANAVTMGWDSPSHFTVGPFGSVYNAAYSYFGRTDLGAPATWTALNWNMCYDYFDTFDETAALANGVSYTQSLGASAGVGPYGTPAVALLAQDEPTGPTQVSTPITGTANSLQDNRFWYVNFRGQFLYNNEYSSGIEASTTIMTDLSTPPTQTSWLTTNGVNVSGTFKRKIDMASVDIYWFSAAVDPTWSGFLRDVGGIGPGIYSPGVALSQADAQRGSNYGDGIDIIRGFQTTYSQPICGLIEGGGPFAAASLDYLITPPQFSWGFWSMIIHGARAICIFDHTGTEGTAQDWWTPAGAQLAYSNPGTVPGSYYANPLTGQTVSILTQITNDCTLLKNLSPAINSPFALGYASVTPAGYSYPTKLQAIQNGVDICVHWYQGSTTNSAIPGKGYYIFATTRNAQTDTNISATFTIKNTGKSTVTVINESRTISITGGTTFTDNFAKASDVHIYYIPG